MTNKSKNLIFSVVALTLSFLLVFTVAFAWLYHETSYKQDLIIYSGDVDLDVDLYMGIDNNGDGILDTTDEFGVALDEQYFLAEKNPVEKYAHEGITDGESIYYKIVVTNPNPVPVDGSQKGAAKISVNFSDLQTHFDDYLPTYTANYANTALTEREKLWTGSFNSQEELEIELQSKTAFIMFKIDKTFVRVYEEGTLKRSSLESDITDKVRTGSWLLDETNGLTIGGVVAVGGNYIVRIGSVDYTFEIDVNELSNLNEGSYFVQCNGGAYVLALNANGTFYVANAQQVLTAINSFDTRQNAIGIPLWLVSTEENFFENIIVNAGETMEIFFCISAMGTADIISRYTEYANSLMVENPVDDQDRIWNGYVDAMRLLELSFFLSDEVGLDIDLSFDIDRIYVKGYNWEGE